MWWIILLSVVGYIAIALCLGAFIGLMIRERDKRKR